MGKPNIEKMKAEGDFEGLIKAWKDPDIGVREEAAVALGEIGDVRVVKPLIQVLRDAKNHWLAAIALEEIGEPAVQPLIKALREGRALGRDVATRVLGRIGDARAVEPLIKALKDDDWDVQRGAIRALGEIGDARAVEPLVQALKDERYSFRFYAAGALGEIGDTGAVEPLTRALKDRDKAMREEAKKALDKIKAKKK